MSQIIKNLASGPVPPSVPTSFVTQDGTAIPALNILLVDGFDSIENNANGIITKGGVVGTGTSNELDIVITNRVQVTTTTTGAQTQNITVLTPTNASAVEFTATFIAYDSANDITGGGAQEGVARKSGGIATIVGTTDSLDQSDAALAAINWNIVASGADLQAQVSGVAAHNLTWTILFTYIQTP